MFGFCRLLVMTSALVNGAGDCVHTNSRCHHAKRG